MAELHEHEAMLLEKALAGLLSDQERGEFEKLLRANTTLRKEWESVQSLKEVTSTMKLKHPPEETWDRYWAGVYARLERGLAWLLISVGTALVLAIAGYHTVIEFLSSSDTPLVVKLAVAALVLGGAILLVSVAREKWYTSKSDKYREVIR
ncbi:MAG: hypothetical protein ACRDGA_06785 [Bacteroidota bacterium]